MKRKKLMAFALAAALCALPFGSEAAESTDKAVETQDETELEEESSDRTIVTLDEEDDESTGDITYTKYTFADIDGTEYIVYVPNPYDGTVILRKFGYWYCDCNIIDNGDGTYTLINENTSTIYSAVIDESGNIYICYSFTDNCDDEYLITDYGNGVVTVTDMNGNESIYTATKNKKGNYTLTDEHGNEHQLTISSNGNIAFATSLPDADAQDENVSDDNESAGIEDETGADAEEETDTDVENDTNANTDIEDNADVVKEEEANDDAENSTDVDAEDGTAYLVSNSTAEMETAEEVGTVTEIVVDDAVTDETTSVKTGDANNTRLWIVVAVVAGAALVAIIGKKRLADQ